MSGYTPTIAELREAWLSAECEERDSTTSDDDLRAEFDRALAAHDAEVRAAVVAEEPGWEYGAQHSQGINAHPSRKQAEEMVAWHAAGDERKQLHARGKTALVRRRKAGPWEAVTDA